MKLRIMQFSQASCSFLSLGFKDFSRTPVNTLNRCSSLRTRYQFSHPYKTTSNIIFTEGRREPVVFFQYLFYICAQCHCSLHNGLFIVDNGFPCTSVTAQEVLSQHPKYPYLK